MFELVSIELKTRDQWVGWRYQERDGKRTKPPVNVKDPARAASSTDPPTWASFAAAAAVLHSGLVEGIGRVVTNDEKLIGFDLDNCRNTETSTLEPWAQNIVDRLNSYTEITPSREGVRVWVYAEIPADCKRRRVGNIEWYSEGRYFTVTGIPVDGVPLTIEARQQEVEELLAELTATNTGNGAHLNGNSATPAVDKADDEALLDLARRARNGQASSQLWDGDTTSHGGDDSAADLALCSHLAFYTGRDPQRIDRLFRRSGLMRDKWNSARGDTTYGAMTIALALDDKKDFYTPPRRDSHPVVTAPKDGSPETADTNAEHSWTPVDLVVAGSTPPEPPAIGGLLYGNRTHILFGPQGALKTMCALAFAVEVIRKDGAVVHIDHAENSPADLLERLRELGLTDDQIRNHFIYMRPDEPATDPTVMRDIVTTIVDKQPALITIDSLIGNLALHNVDPDSGIEIERWRLGVIQPMRCTGSAILALDHVTQNTETRDRPIGSERKLSAFEIGLQAERVRQLARGASGLIRLRNRKDRGAYLAVPIAAEIEFHSNPDTYALTYEIKPTQHTETANAASSFRPTTIMRQVSDLLEQQAAPVSRRTITDAIPSRRQYVLTAIAHLINEGYAAEQDSGGIISERPFRETENA